MGVKRPRAQWAVVIKLKAMNLNVLNLSKKFPIFWIFAMALLTVLFFVGGPTYHSTRSLKYLWDLGHILYFSLLPIPLSSLPPLNRQSPIVHAATVIIVTLVLGVLVELGQSALSRTPDIGDLFRNTIGAGVAICFILPIRKAFSATSMRIFKIVVVVLVMLQVYPAAVALIDEHNARRQFPVLSDFQTSAQLQRWESDAAISIANGVSRQGNSAMRADLDTTLYSGFALKYFPGDWLQYRWFQYSIHNPSEVPIRITCRIHDQLHTQGVQVYADRFNMTNEFTGGWHTITISLDDVRTAPVERKMDLGRIYGVGFFASRLPRPRTIYIDDVKLY